MFFKHIWVRCYKKIRQDIWQLRFPLMIVLLYFLVTNLLFNTCCPYAILFGRSCPACGLTRSGIFVLTGHFSEALALNPTIFLWGPLLFYGLFYRYILDKTPPLFFLLSVIVGVLTVVWFFLSLFQGIRIRIPFDGILPLVVEKIQSAPLFFVAFCCFFPIL